jgi:O-antigen/teichoic acid export membrane protein
MLSSSAPTPAPDRISLKKRVLRAGTWSLAGHGLSQAIRFGSNLLMTRLLVPDMFGVMAIANMVIMGLALFSDLGLRQNIIQSKRGSDPAFLNTAWIIQIFRGIVLWFIALIVSLFVFLADHIGMIPKNSAYADSRLPYVIAILSFGWLIGGFQSTKALEASRNLSLGHVTKIEITGQVAGLLVTFLASIIGFLVNNGDRLLLGGVIDATTLGVYVIAFAIFTSVGSLLDKIISDVAFSALSEVIRERPADLKTSYYRFHIIIGSVAYFCSGILMFSGQSLIALLYDRRYEQAGWMLEILATALLITPFHLAINSLLALGLPRIFTQIIAVRGVVLFILVPLGFHLFGLSGALWALVASYSATLPVTLYYQIKCGFFDLWKTLLPVLAWVPGVLLAELLNFAVTRP